MAPHGTVLEQELRHLNDEIIRIDGEAGEARDAADAFVAQLREQGRDPFGDSEAFAEVDAAYVKADGLRDQAAQLRERANGIMQRLGRADEERRPQAASGAAEAVMASPEYQRLVETGAFHSAGARIELPGVEVISRDAFVQALRNHQPLLHATIDGSPFVPPDASYFPPVAIPMRQVRLPDLVTVGTTSSDTVQYVEETTRTDVAAETALGTAYPEATYEYTAREAAVRDIGQFVPAHRSNLADAGQLQTLIEGRLQAGVLKRLEDQMIAGDGLGQNLKGILETTNIGFVGRNTTGSERLLEAIHRGITAVRVAWEGEPDAIVLHPANYEDIIFEKDDNKGYLLGPAAQSTSRTAWGFPLVITTGIAENTALVGNFRAGAVLWQRSGVTVRASDSHSDFFVRRMVAILAEMRAAFAAWQPRAFAEVNLV